MKAVDKQDFQDMVNDGLCPFCGSDQAEFSTCEVYGDGDFIVTVSCSNCYQGYEMILGVSRVVWRKEDKHNELDFN